MNSTPRPVSQTGRTPAGAPARRAFLRTLLLLAASGAVLLSAGCGEKPPPPPAAPPTVEVVDVVQQDVPIMKDWVATLDGFVNAEIRAKVSGYLLKQEYVNGDFVQKGQPLFQIDPRPFQATLDQAKAKVEHAKGNLAQANGDLQRAQAQLGKTEMDVTRYTPLARESAISQQELDNAVQANLAAKAQVVAAEAAIEAAKAAIGEANAAVDSAQLDLDFTRVISPIGGVAAIATVQVGDLVGPQSGTLTTVSQVDPILANITASEQEYLALMKGLGEMTSTGATAFLRDWQFQLQLANGEMFPHVGHFWATNRQVDVRTGAILVQTRFPNPGNVLRPGGFGRIRTIVRVYPGALLVPQRAVSELQGTFQVAVVGADNKVNIRPVTVGPRIGAMWLIEEGLKPGERVVAEGVQKVRDGMPVTPKPVQVAPDKQQSGGHSVQPARPAGRPGEAFPPTGA
ncbi:MAG TPA: efflux RND transporter periplasmic adaptor subunit [Acidobacteriota bacterium]|nr:efflux RND transporter periplasmic adaptor subunit [Acidobacteriota bacterium]HQM63513.1 efflux RND transporter periplasmic adaptor subunit [Acidobacteriota bacterium]